MSELSPMEVITVEVLLSRFKADADAKLMKKQTVSPFQYNSASPGSGRLFIQTERHLGILYSGCVRVFFPSDLMPRNLKRESGRPFYNWVFSHLILSNARGIENINPKLMNHVNTRCKAPSTEFWTYRRWIRQLKVAANFSEVEEANLLNGVAIRKSSSSSRKFGSVSMKEFKFKKVFPAYLKLIEKSTFVRRIRAALASGLNIELVVPSSVREFITPSLSFDRTFSSTDNLPVVDSNIASVLAMNPSLDALCIVFASVFMLSKEDDWMKGVQ